MATNFIKRLGEGKLLTSKDVDKELSDIVKQTNNSISEEVKNLRVIIDGLYWDDIKIPPLTGRLPTSNPPAVESYKSSEVLSFEDNINNDTIFFDIQFPHTWGEGTIIKPHFHYVLDTSGSGGGAENIKFNLTYSWANINGTFPTATTLTNTVDVQDKNADTHTIFSFGNILPNEKKISSIMLCSISRDISVADNYSGHVYVLSIDFHIQSTIYGSEELFSK